MTRTTYEQRRTMGEQHEDNVLTHLRMAGWDAEPFGQGQLPGKMRAHLSRYTPITPVRWIPDIIAAKVTPLGQQRLVYVDAKAGEQWRRTGLHGCEISSLETADAWQRLSRCWVYYVFTDMLVTTSERIWECGHEGPQTGNGSGTPYLLFPATICEPFEAKFGAVKR